jgi:hypothetical protein
MNMKKLLGGIFLAILGVSIWVVFCEHPWTKHLMIADGWKSTVIVLSVFLAFVAVLNIGIALVRSALSNKKGVENGK